MEGYFGRRVTSVAPQPPAPSGAVWKLSTNGVRSRILRTVSRWTPMPFPWMIRRWVKPFSCAASRYASTTSATSRGGTLWRSKTSPISIKNASFSSIFASFSRTTCSDGFRKGRLSPRQRGNLEAVSRTLLLCEPSSTLYPSSRRVSPGPSRPTIWSPD